MSEQSRLNIAAIVKNCRKAQGMTQLDLVEKSGVSKRVVNEIESGTGNPTLDSLDAIGAALGVELY